jgi:hypothetical protein
VGRRHTHVRAPRACVTAKHGPRRQLVENPGREPKRKIVWQTTCWMTTGRLVCRERTAAMPLPRRQRYWFVLVTSFRNSVSGASAFRLSLRDDKTVAHHHRLDRCIGDHKVLSNAIGKIHIISEG